MWRLFPLVVADRSLALLSSSPPTDGGRTFSSVYPSQLSDALEAHSPSPPPSDSGSSVTELIQRIKDWSLNTKVFGSLLERKGFPYLDRASTVRTLLALSTLIPFSTPRLRKLNSKKASGNKPSSLSRETRVSSHYSSKSYPVFRVTSLGLIRTVSTICPTCRSSPFAPAPPAGSTTRASTDRWHPCWMPRSCRNRGNIVRCRSFTSRIAQSWRGPRRRRRMQCWVSAPSRAS